jgi:hypothetical protein
MDKNLLLFLIMLLLIIIFNCACYTSFESFDNDETENNNETPETENKKKILDYEPSTNDIKPSDVGTRGVFASRDYEKGEILEVCPCIKQEHVTVVGRVADYLFTLNDDESLIAFGYCSMYNHSDDPNAIWHIITEDQMKIETLKKIKKGEEIFISYGSSYWESSKGIKN